ncbi:MAG: hypothetical protein JWQ11_3731 [Rhizobacter sp.]|nr:hypothetical protein [Rhizobacter sp.]
MRIACLAWGSLVWKWAPLRLATPWQEGGPSLPIEFAREGDGGELATALCPGVSDVASLWALLDGADLRTACEQLRVREEIPAERRDGIGCVPTLDISGPYDARIAAWAKPHGVDAVVWTALPARSMGVEGRMPTAEEAIAYLQSLQGDVLAHARDYVRRVPRSITTSYRTTIERRLGWTPEEAVA